MGCKTHALKGKVKTLPQNCEQTTQEMQWAGDSLTTRNDGESFAQGHGVFLRRVRVDLASFMAEETC